MRGLSFGVLGALLLVYVAACTVHRDSQWDADAWEHHRAIQALAENLEEPGNPTYASDAPSIRYSPYSVALALVVRATGADAYDVLSTAAVANTLLLLLGIYAFLRAVGEQRLAPLLIVVMVSLYGGAPGFATSFALQDLPVHQVNPSVFAFALSLFTWALFARELAARRSMRAIPVYAALIATIVLSHAVLVLICVIGLAALVLAEPKERWLRELGCIGIAGALAFCLCVPWPWFDFLLAIRAESVDNPWTNPTVVQLPLTQWGLPAILAALCALPYRGRRIVRVALIAGALCLLSSLAGLAFSSAMLGRVALAGVFFFHLAVAAFVDETGLFDPRTWPGRLRSAAAPNSKRALPALAEIVVSLAVVFLLIPQTLAILREPTLARPYIASWLGREDKQLELKRRFDALLADVGPRDVVLSDENTAWPIPSSRGRIVLAAHFEVFAPDADERRHAVESFFSPDPSVDRLTIIDQYDVRWIVLNRDRLDRDIYQALLQPEAVRAESRELVLMDAHAWAQRAPAPSRSAVQLSTSG